MKTNLKKLKKVLMAFAEKKNAEMKRRIDASVGVEVEFEPITQEEADETYNELRITEEMIDACLKQRASGEVIISGEEGNNFDIVYVDYYNMDKSFELMEFLDENGFCSDWDTAGAIVCRAGR